MAAAEQVLKEKFAKRNVSVKFLGEFKDETTPSEVKRFFNLKSGIDQDSSKKIIALIRENNKKIQCSYQNQQIRVCLLYTSPSPRDMRRSRMPSSA